MSITSILLNLTKHVKNALYQIGLIADYVVETGQTNIWTYRKWASGIAECWGMKTYNSININNSWGSLYSGFTSKPYENYPTELFTTTPNCVITGETTNGNFWVATRLEAGNGTKTRTPAFQVVRPTSVSATSVLIYYHAKGLWKTFTKVGGVILNLLNRRVVVA